MFARQGPWLGVGAWAFAWFFCVLCSYYVIRPVRETMGAMLGQAELQYLFQGVFVIMLVANPCYSWLVARFPRRLLVHLIYRLFELCLLGFWFLLRGNSDGAGAGDQISPWVARVFFIWVSVFNLFAVSIFWSFAADIFAKDQAKSLFGLIAAGGSLGAVVGSFAAGKLAQPLGIAGLLWIPLVLLEVATFLMDRMHRSAQRLRASLPADAPRPDAGDPVGGSMWAGARRILQSPYLLGICAILMMSQLCGTTAYLQQSEIVPANVTESAEQLKVFANINLWGQILTVILQAVVAGALMRFVGLSVTLCVLPIVYLVSFLALSADTSLLVLSISQVLQRGTSLGLMVPAEHALFTVVPREDKYKAKSFIDTAVFRGGDVLASWLFARIRTAQWTLAEISYLMIPVIAIWTAVAWWLGRAARKAMA